VLGLRPGEALRCAHAHDGADGCGTGGACPSCGAAMAMVVSLATDRPAERECALAAEGAGATRDLVLWVRAAPVRLDGARLLLLVLRDVTDEHWRLELERTFFHDVSNVLCSMVSAADLQERGCAPDPDLLPSLVQGTRRLAREVEVQRVLARGEPQKVRLRVAPVAANAMVESMRRLFASHPAARDRRLTLRTCPTAPVLATDAMLLERVLANMLTNAFEAVPAGAEVVLGVEDTGDGVAFCVGNPGTIASEARARIFQAHFSTKGGSGRGLGTYSMRLFGETVLRGKVSFESCQAQGTIFRLWLPPEPPVT
jgi:signal transduction histidine kinase